MPSPSRLLARGGPFRTWVRAGLWAGALLGLADTTITVARGVGGLGIEKSIRLVVLGASLLAVVGLLAGAVIGLGAGALAEATRRRASRKTAAEWLVTLAILPLVAYDARAMFAGHYAASLPFHQFLAAAVGIAALAVTYLLARAYRHRLELASTPGGSRRPTCLAAWALLAAAAGVHVANLLVLVRLYSWFHATVTVLTGVLTLLAVRLFLAEPTATAAPPALVRRLAPWATVLICVLSLHGLRRSQILRFASYERAALVGQVLRRLPLLAGPARAAPEMRSTESVPLPPLPDGPHRDDADVLIITVDALRADHVGAYGYPRPITPNVDALAARSTRFARAYAQAPHTSFSVASMLTGKYFATMARLAPGQVHEPLATVMRTYGWRTAAFYPPAVFYIDADKLKAYAATNFGFEYVKFEYLDAERRVDQIVDYYQTVRPTKAFVWVHFFEPHEPYQIHTGFELGDAEVDRYDSEIAYVDAAIGRLLAYVKSHRPGTVVVLTADHGEEFDEHGGRYHGSTLYEEQLRVPLLVAVPQVSPAVVDGPVELVDITPTVLNLLNIPVPVRMRGTDLGPWMARPPAADQRLPPAFGEVDDRRMIARRDDKLICDLHGAYCAYYDLVHDPHEQQNLIDARPQQAAELRGILNAWLDEHIQLEPMTPVSGEGEPPPRAIERGRLGDAQVARELAIMLGSPAPLEQRREAARLLAVLSADPGSAAALARAAVDPDPAIADWVQVSRARLGDPVARARVQALIADQAADIWLRVRGALALAGTGDPHGVPLLGQTLDPCPDVALCREIITTLGRLRDRRAVPFLIRALTQVQNRREMVIAIGDIGDRAARSALIDRLESDEYVPVRIEAARALAKLRDASAAPALDRVASRETEPAVATAARAAARALRRPLPER